MQVRIRLFAMLRERAGTPELDLELAEGATAGDALRALAERPELAAALAATRVVVARNRRYVGDAERLADGDEVAVVPPVSGGAWVHARVSAEPLDVSWLARAVVRPEAGAVVTFCGVTREVERLEYEAYAEMALERIRGIATEAAERHRLEAVAAEHRVGSVPLGEPSVVVSVSAAHRDAAFAGAREVIDRIKAEAPIWKREVRAPGAAPEWVAGTPPPVS